MDAQQYYIRGIAAVKQKDLVNGRKLLLQSVKLDSQNDQAWVWIAQTIAEPPKKIECLDRALAINPNNRQAQRLKDQLQSATQRQPTKRASKSDRQQIRRLMQEADTLIKQNRKGEAVDKWVMVLDIQHDHETAVKNAVAYYMERDMMDEIKTLLYNAVDLGTENPTILLSARDIAKTEKTMERYDELNDMISQADWVSPKQLLRTARDYESEEHYDIAVRILQNGLETHKDNPELLNGLAQIHEKTGRDTLALQYYERVANSAVRSKIGKEADKRLSQAVPIMSDTERGSSWIAWREILGIFTLFFLLALQDAGLNLGAMGSNRWLGVLLALVGSFLVVTATSSPQQQPLARLLGGRVPDDAPKSPQRRMNPFASVMTSMGMDIDEENYHVGPILEPTRLPIVPRWIRWVFGLSGLLMLFLAFQLVLSQAIGLVGLPQLNLDPQFYEVMGEISS